MKKITMAFLLLVFMISGCSNEVGSKNVSLDFPTDVKTKIENLPEEIQSNLKYPTEFPNDPSFVSFSYQTTDINNELNGDIIFTEFTYGGDEKGWMLHVTTWHSEVPNLDSSDYETVTLTNGIEANIKKNSQGKVLEWINENGELNSLLLMQTSEERNYTIDDLVEVANSMVERK